VHGEKERKSCGNRVAGKDEKERKQARAATAFGATLAA